MERIFISHKRFAVEIFFLFMFFTCFLILSQSAWSQTTLTLRATWTAPTTNTDGTPLIDLASFNVYRTDVTPTAKINTSPIPPSSGTAASPYLFQVTLSGMGTLTFYATAVDSGGLESAPSATASFPYNLTPMTCIMATNPTGLQITVDGTLLTTPKTFSAPTTWMVGQSHTLSVTSQQTPKAGEKDIFSKWDNGSTSLTRTITVPSTDTTYTATFTTQYSLTTSANPSAGGTVTPSGTAWYNSGQTVSASAKPNSGYTFTNWSVNGNVSGSSSSLSLPMTGPMNVVANFSVIQDQVSTPKTPKNVTNGSAGTSYSFSSKSTSSLGNPVQYQYDWGDTTTLVWGPATQSHFWVNAGSYQVTVLARSSTGVESSVSLPASVMIINENAFIHLISPNGGETWVAGATHPITWDSNYLDSTGTIYLFYWYGGAWHPITNSVDTPGISPSSSASSPSYDWQIPTTPPSVSGSPVPKSHMSWTAIYIGNWVNGALQCSDTNDKSFKILDDGWLFTISGADKGGAYLFFNADESSFDGYGVSLNLGKFKIIQGSYTVNASGQITGSYQLSDHLSDFSENPLPNVTGNITGTLNTNATTMKLTLTDQNSAPVFTMSGAWVSEATMPVNWSVQISGSAKGTISPSNPLTIKDYQDSNSEVYANIYTISGSGTLSADGTPISIDGYFFFTPQKSFTGNTVYGIYDHLIISSLGIDDAGTFSGTLNPTTGKFTFNLTSDNGNKYKFVGVATP